MPVVSPRSAFGLGAETLALDAELYLLGDPELGFLVGRLLLEVGVRQVVLLGVDVELVAGQGGLEVGDGLLGCRGPFNLAEDLLEGVRGRRRGSEVLLEELDGVGRALRDWLSPPVGRVLGHRHRIGLLGGLGKVPSGTGGRFGRQVHQKDPFTSHAGTFDVPVEKKFAWSVKLRVSEIMDSRLVL